MRRSLRLLAGLLVVVFLGRAPAAGAADAPPVVRVSQESGGDFQGTDETPILQALARLNKQPGTIEIGPGEFTIHRTLALPAGTTLRGRGQTVLRLPPPVVVRQAAPAGQDFLLLDDTRPLANCLRAQIVLHDNIKRPPGTTTGFPVLPLTAVQADRLVFAKPLPVDVPAGSFVGSPHNLIEVRGPAAHVRVENLTLDGGRTPKIPMPGHVERCAVLAQGVFSYEKGPTAPPVDDLVISGCTIRNCYGRAVAFYSVVRSKVTGCQVEDIDDESIDLDHFAFHCEVSDNTIRRGQTGVTINDGAYCLVARNHIEQCGVGITVWWWKMCPQTDIDVENVIRQNTVRQCRDACISIGKRCYRNQVIENTVDGKIRVQEEDNVVRDNRS